MKTILLLLSISPFFLGKANSWHDPSHVHKNAPWGWRPRYMSDNDDSTGITFAGGPARKCIDCVRSPNAFHVGTHKYRPNYARHRRPDKQNRRIPNSPRWLIETGFTAPKKHHPQYPYRPSPWLPHKPNLSYPNRYNFVIPERSSPGSGPIISVPCVKKTKKCLRTGSRNWSRSVIPATGSVSNNDSCECGISEAKRMVINGSIVYPPFKYPWMVAIQEKDGSTFCGGAIVSDQYILTPAHCFKNSTTFFYKPSEIQVAFVTNTYRVSKGEDVSYFIAYPQSEFWKKDHDICLLKLRKRIQCSEQRRPICLPTHGMQVHVGQEFVTAGWGSLDGVFPDVPPFLMETTIKLVDFQRCSLFSEVKENYHCLQSNNSSPCHGDSGGPMFLEHQNRFYVFGVTAQHSDPLCGTSDTFVYAKVTNYLDWIRNETRH